MQMQQQHHNQHASPPPPPHPPPPIRCEQKRASVAAAGHRLVRPPFTCKPHLFSINCALFQGYLCTAAPYRQEYTITYTDTTVEFYTGKLLDPYFAGVTCDV